MKRISHSSVTGCQGERHTHLRGSHPRLPFTTPYLSVSLTLPAGETLSVAVTVPRITYPFFSPPAVLYLLNLPGFDVSPSRQLLCPNIGLLTPSSLQRVPGTERYFYHFQLWERKGHFRSDAMSIVVRNRKLCELCQMLNWWDLCEMKKTWQFCTWVFCMNNKLSGGDWIW